MFRGKKFKSAEHAIQWTKASDLGLNNIAQWIRNAKHAGVAKAISTDISIENSKQWEDSSQSIMQEILKNKFTQNPDLLVVLEETSGKPIAQTTQDRIWGTGLNKQLTVLTNPSFWPGKNMLGTMLIELRE